VHNIETKPSFTILKTVYLTSFLSWPKSLGISRRPRTAKELAADGVGAAVKRCADESVAQGKDVNNFEEFFELLKEKSGKIQLFDISEQMIEEEKQNVPELKTLKGTMDVHQVCWLKEENVMNFRRLSCFQMFADIKAFFITPRKNLWYVYKMK
jgi:hypothetical protein